MPNFDYFYGNQADQFTFYRIPKLLFQDECFNTLSIEAKLLYGMFLDRMSLSARNQWFDDSGRVYIIFTLEEVMGELACGDNKATRLFGELEKIGLIERKRRGLGKPSLIYVKNFASAVSDSADSRLLNRENHDSGIAEFTTLESRNSRVNNTYNINTDNINTDSFFLSASRGKGTERNDKYEQYRQCFFDRLNIYDLRVMYPEDIQTIDGIVHLLVDVMCCNRSVMRIAREDKPIEIVRAQMMKLEAKHIEYILGCLAENAKEVKDMKQYLLTTLYNAPITMSAHYG